MSSLIIYDSNYGNTKLVAEAIAQDLQTTAISVDAVKPEHLTGLTLLIVGSPIIAWRPTIKMANWLAGLKPDQLRGVKVAAFDTRVKLFIHGNAAKLIGDALVRLGAMLVSKPEGFIVNGKAGPLAAGELERAKGWAKELLVK
jgi:flavodoxin